MKTKTTYELSAYNLSRLIIGGGLIGGSIFIIILARNIGYLLLLPCMNIVLGIYIVFLGMKSAKIHKYHKNTGPIIEEDNL